MQSWQRRFTVGLCAALCLGAAVAEAAGVSPTPAEEAALRSLRGRLVGQVIWESNRDGHWQLFTMNADGTGARRLTSSAGDDTDARFSSDGTRVLFTRRLPGESEAVWLINADGSGARKLISNASGAEWRQGDRAIQFLRRVRPGEDAWGAWACDPATLRQVLLFPLPGIELEPRIHSGLGNDEGTRFVARSLEPEGTWICSPDGRFQKLVHAGSEGQVAPDQRYAYGVHESGRFVRFNLADGGDLIFFRPRTGEWTDPRFPRVSADGQWLTYGACPAGEADPEAGDYEIFVVPLKNWATPDEPVRLTFNTSTDRWADIFVAPAGAANPLADGPGDTAENVAVNATGEAAPVAPTPPAAPPATPTALSIFSFAADGAAPDWGGDSGLWPQVEGCGGEAVWVAEDAEGGAGGSMRITWDISGDPRSFSMWFAPEAAVDLSRFERFVIYARGDVPSFTLVVKDSSADPEGATDLGIADLVITGVTDRWQRFAPRFTEFRPRVAGGAIDWSAINHVGVAMIGDRNATSGTLQVDNLRAITAD